MNHDPATSSASAPRLATPRLMLRPLSVYDLESLHALLVLPGVRRHLFDGRILARADVVAMLGESARRFDGPGAGLWAVTETADPAVLAGIVGFWRFEHRGPWPPEDELVFALNESHWGRGLATEASEAALGHARDALGWMEVQATVDDGNCAAVRTVARLGFREFGHAFGPGSVLRVFRKRL